MKLNIKKIRDYFYIFLLLCFSGNPVFHVPDGSKAVFSIVTFLLIIIHFKKLVISESKHLYIFLFFFSVIFTLQWEILGFVSTPGVLGFFLRLIFGYIIVATIESNFRYIYFNVIVFISLVSLICYLLNISGFNFPSIYQIDDLSKSIIFYTQLDDGIRNTGMFWEPGAFACYINLGFLFYIGDINELLKISKIKLIIVLLALVTTYSTTGYLVLFLIIIIYIFQQISWRNALLTLPFVALFLFASFMIYEKSKFLKEKIETQYEDGLAMHGDFSPSRFGAFMFDVYYIKKHPLTGNGLHKSTRYADHPYLINQKLGHGNGFSDFLASMGFLSLFLYSYYILRYRIQNKWIFLLIIYLLLQGEHLLSYPLFLSIPFILLFDKYHRISDNLIEQF